MTCHDCETCDAFDGYDCTDPARDAAIGEAVGFETCDDCDGSNGVDRGHCIQCPDCYSDDSGILTDAQERAAERRQMGITC